MTMAPPKSHTIFTIVLLNFTFSLAACGSEERRMIVCHLNTGSSLRAGDRGFSPATKRVAPGYFYWKIEEK